MKQIRLKNYSTKEKLSEYIRDKWYYVLLGETYIWLKIEIQYFSPFDHEHY